MTRDRQLIVRLALDQRHCVVVVILLLFHKLAFVQAQIILSVKAVVVRILEVSIHFEQTLLENLVILSDVFFHFIVLGYHNVDLRVKHELFADDPELELVELLGLLVVVPPHLLILLLEQRYVLKAGLLVIE